MDSTSSQPLYTEELEGFIKNTYNETPLKPSFDSILDFFKKISQDLQLKTSKTEELEIEVKELKEQLEYERELNTSLSERNQILENSIANLYYFLYNEKLGTRDGRLDLPTLPLPSDSSQLASSGLRPPKTPNFPPYFKLSTKPKKVSYQSIKDTSDLQEEYSDSSDLTEKHSEDESSDHFPSSAHNNVISKGRLETKKVLLTFPKDVELAPLELDKEINAHLDTVRFHDYIDRNLFFTTGDDGLCIFTKTNSDLSKELNSNDKENRIVKRMDKDYLVFPVSSGPILSTLHLREQGVILFLTSAGRISILFYSFFSAEQGQALLQEKYNLVSFEKDSRMEGSLDDFRVVGHLDLLLLNSLEDEAIASLTLPEPFYDIEGVPGSLLAQNPLPGFEKSKEREDVLFLTSKLKIIKYSSSTFMELVNDKYDLSLQGLNELQDEGRAIDIKELKKLGVFDRYENLGLEGAIADIGVVDGTWLLVLDTKGRLFLVDLRAPEPSDYKLRLFFQEDFDLVQKDAERKFVVEGKFAVEGINAIYVGKHYLMVAIGNSVFVRCIEEVLYELKTKKYCNFTLFIESKNNIDGDIEIIRALEFETAEKEVILVLGDSLGNIRTYRLNKENMSLQLENEIDFTLTEPKMFGHVFSELQIYIKENIEEISGKSQGKNGIEIFSCGLDSVVKSYVSKYSI